MNLYALDTDVVSSLRLVERGILLSRGVFRSSSPRSSGGSCAMEAETFVRLQEPPKTEGAGEHSIIAYCHHHPEVTIVLQDKGALRRAVEELRVRVLSFHGFLGTLVSEGYIDWVEAREFATRYRKYFNHARIPIWWPPPSGDET